MPVSLENLLKIGQLKEHPPDVEEIERLLVAAQRNLRDAQNESISPETRFDAAYKAIMQCGLAALMMHGYRPDTTRPGHHMIVIQSTPFTIGLDSKRMVVLDAMRRQRTVADYTGDDVDQSTAQNCLAEAKRLIDDVLKWRAVNRPKLVPTKAEPRGGG
jgi:uncharacterized protein (UPF0332 family)